MLRGWAQVVFHHNATSPLLQYFCRGGPKWIFLFNNDLGMLEGLYTALVASLTFGGKTLRIWCVAVKYLQ